MLCLFSGGSRPIAGSHFLGQRHISKYKALLLKEVRLRARAEKAKRGKIEGTAKKIKE
jgi:hypothetical protein